MVGFRLFNQVVHLFDIYRIQDWNNIWDLLWVGVTSRKLGKAKSETRSSPDVQHFKTGLEWIESAFQS